MYPLFCCVMLLVYLDRSYCSQGQDSCKDRCGKYDPSRKCQCNSICASKVDCCDDFEEICDASCLGRCYSDFNIKEICHCNDLCLQHENCCPNFNATCIDNNAKCQVPNTITAVYKTECLIFINETRTWDQSKKFCNDKGCIMVEKIDNKKHEIMEQTLYKHFGTKESWIGLRRRDDGDGYKWVSGVTQTTDWPWFQYVPVNDEPTPGNGRCVAMAGAGPDRTGGGWRHRPCNNTLLTICQIEIAQIPEQNNSSSIRTSSLSTVMSSTTTSTPDTSTSPSPTTLPATTTTTIKPTTISVKSSTTTTTVRSSTATSRTLTTTTKTTAKTPLSSSDVTVERSTITANNLTNQNSQGKSREDKSILVIIGVLIGVAVLIIASVITFIVYRRKKRRQSTAVSLSGNGDLNYTSADSNEYSVSLPVGTASYDHIMVDGNRNISDNVSEQIYDKANVTEGRQINPTFDATYDRAMFSQSDTSMDGNVYDQANVTLLTSALDEKKILSDYDHAFVQ